MTASVVVRPVRSAADLKRFIALPYVLHRGDPLWVPPLRRDVRKALSREKNPFFQHAEAEYYLAERDGEILGRIAAIHNRAHNEFNEDTAGFFGFLECVDDLDAARPLFEAAGGWIAQRGLTILRGPMSFSTNDECGLLVDGFDTPPTVMNPHNPRYYIDLVERCGFTKAKDLYQYRSVNPTIPAGLIERVESVLERQNITLRTLDMKHFDDEVERVKRIYNRAWEKNWGFVPMTEREIDHLAKQMKPVVVPELVIFVEHRGEPIGFAVVLPDLNVALKKNPSGRFFPGILKILWAARKITRVRILLLGLLPEYRGIGADALMYHWIWRTGYELGYRWAEAGWILEDNGPMNNAIKRLGFERYKTLRIYDRPL